MDDQTQMIPASRGIMERPYTAAEIKAQVNQIQEVIEAVFEEGHHYGNIPGTQGKTLLKPGAEKLNLTFRIAPDPIVEDLSTEDEMRYRVKCVANHIVSGDYLGAGVGECSSNEDKYKWRRTTGKKEFAATPEDRRRIAFKRKKDRTEYTVEQVRTNPPDIANTILKMAKKRAMVDMCLTVTAASDIFVQDFDDMTPEMRHALGQDDEDTLMEPKRKEAEKKEPPKKKAAPPKKKAEPRKKPPVAKQKTGGVLERTPGASEPPPAPEGDPDPPDAFQQATADRQEPPEVEEETTAADPDDVPFGEPPDEEEDFLSVQITTAKEGKSGTSERSGKRWQLYEIETSSGDKLTTFNERLYQEAVAACKEGLLCKVFYEENQYGFTLTAIEAIG